MQAAVSRAERNLASLVLDITEVEILKVRIQLRNDARLLVYNLPLRTVGIAQNLIALQIGN